MGCENYDRMYMHIVLTPICKTLYNFHDEDHYSHIGAPYIKRDSRYSDIAFFHIIQC